MTASDDPDQSALRVALLSYRSKAHSGGQGVYVRELSRGLAAAGHHVTVFSGQPYPQLACDDGLPGAIELVQVPSLDLYREPDPFRTPGMGEFRDRIDVVEYLTMISGAFPEPLTFSLRAERLLRSRVGDFDVVHDNQCLGYGLDAIASRFPLVTTIHHPITRDRAAELAVASRWRRRSVRRWYSFLRMQQRVAASQSHVLTVSSASARAIAADFAVSRARLHVVPLGVDTARFHPLAATQRVPGRIVAVASSDTAIKGVDTFLEAVARVRAARPGCPLEVVMVCRPQSSGLAHALVDRLGLGEVVRFVWGVSQEELAQLLASAQVGCTPSRYEGFSLPTVEMMASGTPLVVTTAGALPEVVGGGTPPDAQGAAAILVPPGDVRALADGLVRLLEDESLRVSCGQTGRARAVQRYDWASVARATAQVYRAAIRARRVATAPVV